METLRSVVTAAVRPVECDLEKRILRGAVFATTGVAADGWIILPEAMELGRYQANPIVTARHLVGAAQEEEKGAAPLVMANAIALVASSLDLVAEVQFADTAAAREWGHLYGINPERHAYMRGWSIEAPILERASVDWKTARTLSGPHFDATLAERLKAARPNVMVATRSELRAVAMVPCGADRAALTRALEDGIHAAGEILARLDLDEADAQLAALRRQVEEYEQRWMETDARLVRLEREIQALRGEGASAAARGDSEATLTAVREMRQLLG
jgi:hypothetical protein